MNAIAECRVLTEKLRHSRGTLVGIACRQGRFAVTETRTVRRKTKTECLTGWQSHAECLAHMRALAG